MTDVLISLSVANTLLQLHRCGGGGLNCSANRELSAAIDRATAETVPDARQAWPLRDVFRRLADFADHMLTECDYDGRGHDDRYGHEVLRVCVDRAREILAAPPDSEITRLREWLEGIQDYGTQTQAADPGDVLHRLTQIISAAIRALNGESEDYRYRTKKEK